jgi:hypothetical protein
VTLNNLQNRALDYKHSQFPLSEFRGFAVDLHLVVAGLVTRDVAATADVALLAADRKAADNLAGANVARYTAERNKHIKKIFWVLLIMANSPLDIPCHKDVFHGKMQLCSLEGLYELRADSPNCHQKTV